MNKKIQNLNIGNRINKENPKEGKFENENLGT